MKDIPGKAWAVFFSVIMVLSMITLSGTLVGPAAAQSSQITELQDPDVRDIIEGEDTLEVYVEVKFFDRNSENEDLIWLY